MAKSKSTSTLAEKKKSVKKTAAKNIGLKLHLPGNPIQEVKYPVGTTVAEIIKDRNLDGYTVSVNGSSAGNSQILADGDTVRIGVKTKNG